MSGVPAAARLFTLLAAGLAFGVTGADAARIGDLVDLSLAEQIARFFSLQDPSLRYAVAGSILLGISCGLLGSFIVVRKMALMGDALSHAVLPGVALGFLWNLSKDPLAIFIGATLAGLLGTVMVGLIRQTTRLKEDTALGLVLASFFAVGICLTTMIQRLPSGNKSGIDRFLFGQAAAIGPDDLVLMAVVTGLTILVLVLFYKDFLVASFDPDFAGSIGFPVQWLHHALMLLLAFSVVIALQAVGVVLVSAMLITPAAAAYLLTDRMHRMLFLAALFGLASGVCGAFLSFLGSNLPTGPLMVLAASALFLVAYLFAPRHGVLAKAWRRRSQARRIGRENTLKWIYHILEAREFLGGHGVTVREIAELRRETLEEAEARCRALRRHRLATVADHAVFLTPAGWQRAEEIVRNHRLWELYLTHSANFAADHVHDDAEKIEHILGGDVLRELERRLNFATRDPHGRRIPAVGVLRGGAAAVPSTDPDPGPKRSRAPSVRDKP